MTGPAMKKLAKELALAFHKDDWSEVEDDVCLCLWLKKQCGEEFSLHQAASMRQAMCLEIEKFPQVVIYIQDGIVHTCTSNDARLRVVIVGDRMTDAERAEVLADATGCEHEVF